MSSPGVGPIPGPGLPEDDHASPVEQAACGSMHEGTDSGSDVEPDAVEPGEADAEAGRGAGADGVVGAGPATAPTEPEIEPEPGEEQDADADAAAAAECEAAAAAAAREAAGAATAAARERVADLLMQVDEGRVLIAASQARHAVSYAEAARSWACPHAVSQVARAAGASSGLADVLGDEVRAARVRRDRASGLISGAGSEAGVHEGYHGICLESIEGLTLEVAAREHVSPAVAGAAIRAGIRLDAVLPHTLAAWSQGVLHARQVDVIVAGTNRVVDDTLARVVDERLCGPGADQLPATMVLSGRALAAKVRQVVAEVDVAAEAAASRRATARRRAEVWNGEDGQASLCLTGPAPAVLEMKAALDAAAAAAKAHAAARNRAGLASQDRWAIPEIDGPRDGRGVDAHRFDAAHDLLTGGLTWPATETTTETTPEATPERATRPAGDQAAGDQAAGEAPPSTHPSDGDGDGDSAAAAGSESSLVPVRVPRAGRPSRPVEIFIGLPTVVGLNDAPAFLVGYGPFSAWMARACLGDTPARRFLTDPLTGALVHVDAHAYPAGTLAGLRRLNTPGGLAEYFTRPGDPPEPGRTRPHHDGSPPWPTDTDIPDHHGDDHDGPAGDDGPGGLDRDGQPPGRDHGDWTAFHPDLPLGDPPDDPDLPEPPDDPDDPDGGEPGMPDDRFPDHGDDDGDDGDGGGGDEDGDGGPPGGGPGGRGGGTPPPPAPGPIAPGTPADPGTPAAPGVADPAASAPAPPAPPTPAAGGTPTPPPPGASGGVGSGPCRPVDPAHCPVRRAGALHTLTTSDTDTDADTAEADSDGRAGQSTEPVTEDNLRALLAEVAAGRRVPGLSGPYTPPAAVARFVRRHWVTCTHPGCWRPATTCDLDHTLAWPAGTTCSCNLAPLCERHHLAKHGTPRFGGGPAAAWATRAGTLPWPWTLWRCTNGHQHWRSPWVSNTSSPRRSPYPPWRPAHPP